MQTEIWIGDKGNVDFSNSIEMSEDEKRKFITLMKYLFNPVEVEEVSQFRNWRMGQNKRIQYPHAWTPAEYEILLNASSVEEAVNKLGRSGMSIIIRSGEWVSKYYMWCENKGKDVADWNKVENIKQFLKEHDEEIFKKRKIKTSANQLKKLNKKIEDLSKKIEEYSLKAKEFEFTSIGKAAQINLKEAENKKKEIESERDKLKKELG